MRATKINWQNAPFDDILDAAQNEDNTGFCVSCWSQQGSCEPDARSVKCDSCGQCTVYGAEEIILMSPYGILGSEEPDDYQD